MLPNRLTRLSALIAVALIYLSRPWSCGHVLGTFSPEDKVPYAHFDYHGVAAALGWLLALLFALPTLWLVGLAIGPSKIEMSTPSERISKVALPGSLMVALALGAPSLTQVAYLVALPLTVVWPVVASSLAWLAATVVLWLIFIRRRDAGALAASSEVGAVLLSGCILVPKLAMMGVWVARGVWH